MKISNALHFITPLVLTTSFGAFAQINDSRPIVTTIPMLQGLALNIAEGGVATGGGDPCEMRIQEIRDDIRAWVLRGGHSGLTYNSSTKEEYANGMQAYLAIKRNSDRSISQATDIECVHRRIVVQGHEKICRFDRLAGPKITCDYEAFMDSSTLSEDDQYRLIHHEYAGLAGIENPDGFQSQYEFSDQISKFLENQVIRKLAMRPQLVPDCRSLDLRAVPAGTKCRTAKGSIYERVWREYFGEAWKGPDGMVWSDLIGSGTQYEAVDLCKNLGGVLPSRSDFERGEASGFREVLPNMTAYSHYWSSSLDRPTGGAYIFSAGSGGADFNYHRITKVSVRCNGW